MILSEGTLSRLGKAADHEENHHVPSLLCDRNDALSTKRWTYIDATSDKAEMCWYAALLMAGGKGNLGGKIANPKWGMERA
jgi:hypothetical protein